MKKVYRVEDKQGRGPYIDGFWMSEPHEASTGRPTPGADGLTATIDEWKVRYGGTNVLFGFASLQDLCCWFDREELKRLFGNGYRITVYQTDTVKVSESGKQLIFIKKKRRRHVLSKILDRIQGIM